MAEGERARAGFDEQRIGMAVVAAFEFHDQLAAGKAAREPDRRHGRFSARRNEPHPLERGHELAQALGKLCLLRGGRAV